MSGICFEPTEVRGGTAEDRAERALQQIEGAQELLAAAARNLCPIIGAAPQHAAIVKLYDRVHGYWYKLDAKLNASARLGKWRLDSYATAAARMPEEPPEPQR